MRLNRICSLEYINTQLDLSDLRDVEKPIEDNDMLQYDLTTKTWQTKKVLDNITLGSPWTLAGDGFWTGFSEWDISGGSKTIIFGSTNTFSIEDTNGLNFLQFRGIDNNIFFGNPTDNTKFDFLGSGIANFAGPIEVDQLGPNDGTDPLLIELATDQVDINGAMTVLGQIMAESAKVNMYTRTGESTLFRQVATFTHETTAATIPDTFGTSIRFDVADSGGSGLVGRLGFYRNGADNTGRFAVQVSDAGSLSDTMSMDENGEGYWKGKLRIGDTTAPTEAMEVNGNIVQSEANGSRYLLRYSLMGA
jgi:hypothetical protein